MDLAHSRARLAGTTRLGIVFTLASAVFMAWLGVVTQLAYEAGASVGTLLSGRFAVAAVVLWAIVLVVRRPRPDRRRVIAGLALGAGYSVHAWLFSESLVRLDAGLVDLLVFTYPALVVVGAVLLGRERASGRRLVALVTVTAGAAVVLLGGVGTIDLLGAGLALAAAVAYAIYILLSFGQLEQTDGFLLTALVTTGAGVTLTTAALVQGDVSLAADADAYALVVAVGLVAAAGMGALVAGIGSLGPSRASIVSAVQPALTPIIGFAVFADRLGIAQALGGLLVVGGILILEARGLWPRSEPGYEWLPRRERRRLPRFTHNIAVPAGGAVMSQGASADGLYLILRGRARVVRDDRQVAELGPGDFVGEIALLEGGPRTASVVAVTELTARVISRDDFRTAMRFLPALGRRVREVARDRLGAAHFDPMPASR